MEKPYRKADRRHFTLDKEFDGVEKTHPKGVICIVSEAGGQSPYDPEQGGMPETWQKFTTAFVSKIHSFTVVDVRGGEFALKQVSKMAKFSIRFASRSE
jgi:hypothetical protein